MERGLFLQSLQELQTCVHKGLKKSRSESPQTLADFPAGQPLALMGLVDQSLWVKLGPSLIILASQGIATLLNIPFKSSILLH